MVLPIWVAFISISNLLFIASYTSFNSGLASIMSSPAILAFSAFCTAFALPTYAGYLRDKAN